MDKIKQSALPLGIIVTLSLIFFFLPLSTQLELNEYDWRLEKLRGSEIPDKISVISIDQASLDKLGAFPWKRSIYADLLNVLKEKNPKLLIFDILFQEPSPSDAEFAKAIKDSGITVVLPYNFAEVSMIETRIVPPVEPLEKAARATGFIDYAADRDGIIRRAILAQKLGDKIYPSLDLVSYALMKGVDVDKIIYEKDRIIVGSSIIHTSPDYKILIDYYIPKQKGGTKQTFPVRSFFKFLNPMKTPDLTGFTLIVGAGAPGLRDDFPVPVQKRMYGAEIHANIINTLVRGSNIRELPLSTNLGIVLLLAFIYGFFLFRTASVWKLIGASLLLLVAHSLINLYFFQRGIWIYWVQPTFVIFAGTLVVSAFQFFRTHKLFQQFVVKEVVDSMVASDKGLKMGGEEKEVSILFSDIRGYTTLSEKISPSEVMNMLNEYHAEMVKIFHKYDGRVFSYQGDAQMVVFGAPIERKDHALCACRAALEMTKALEKLQEKWKLEQKELFEIGVGICTGIAAIGIVGAEGALQYTAIGDTTNVAARLQAQSKVLGAPIIISKKTKDYIKDIMEYRSLGMVELKGKTKPVEVFTVIGEKKKEEDS